MEKNLNNKKLKCKKNEDFYIMNNEEKNYESFNEDKNEINYITYDEIDEKKPGKKLTDEELFNYLEKFKPKNKQQKIESTITAIIDDSIKQENKNNIIMEPSKPVYDVKVKYLHSLNQKRDNYNEILLDENLFTKYKTLIQNQGFYELLSHTNKTKIFFDFDDIFDEFSFGIIKYRLSQFLQSVLNIEDEIDFLVQKRVVDKKIKAHIITKYFYADKKQISIMQKIINKMKILCDREIDYHAINHDQFRNSYWPKKPKYDLHPETNSHVEAQDIDELLHSFVTVIHHEMEDITNQISKFNEENKHLFFKPGSKNEDAEIYVEDIDNQKIIIKEYIEKLNDIKIDPRNIIFHELSDGKQYLMRKDFCPFKKPGQEIYLNKCDGAEPLTRGAPILVSPTKNGFKLISMYHEDDKQCVYFSTKKSTKNFKIDEDIFKDWIEDENLQTYDEAELKFNHCNLIEGKPGCGKTHKTIEHMKKYPGLKLIIETRLSQRITHKQMILSFEPDADIIEIDGNHKQDSKIFVDKILDEKCWFIINDLSFYRFKKYFEEALWIDPELKKPIILVDEAHQIISNLALCNNELFKNVDLKNIFLNFIEKYCETSYFTDLINTAELKTLIKKTFENHPTFNEVKLRSKQTINNLTIKNDMKFFLRKTINNYLTGKKSLLYFDTILDLQTAYLYFNKKKIDLNDILVITGEHDNREDFKFLDEKKIVMTTSKIFNCLTIDCKEDDEIFIFTSNQKMINNVDKLNSSLRQRKSKNLNICINNLGLILDHECGKEIKNLLKYNFPYYEYINSFNKLTMIEAIKNVINRGENFKLNNLIDEKIYRIKKKKIVRLNGDKHIKQEKIIKLLTQDHNEQLELFNKAKKIDPFETDEAVLEIINKVKIEDLDKKLTYLTNNKNIDELKKQELILKIKQQEIINMKKDFVIDICKSFKKENEEKYKEIEHFVTQNNLNMNTLDFEVKNDILNELDETIKKKDYEKLNGMLVKYHKDFILYKNNEIIETNLKRDNKIIFDQELIEEEYSIRKTKEIIKKYQGRSNKYINYIFVGYDLVNCNLTGHKKLIKNNSTYHLCIYDSIVTLKQN
jgi:hypothetical protein